MKKYLILIVAIITVPLGLLTENPAWGEWELEELKKMIGFVPKGMEENQAIFGALIPDYKLEILGSVPSYYLSAIIGSILCIGIMWLLKPKQA